MMPEEQAPARRLMKAHQELGCQPTFTCAPYQTPVSPGLRRADRLGRIQRHRLRQFGDRRAHQPLWRLHRPVLRHDRPRAGLGPASRREPAWPHAFRLSSASLPDAGRATRLTSRSAYRRASEGDRVPVIEGLPQPRDEDQLKALGAAAASTGAVGAVPCGRHHAGSADARRGVRGRAPEDVVELDRRRSARRAARDCRRVARRRAARRGLPRHAAFLACRMDAAAACCVRSAGARRCRSTSTPAARRWRALQEEARLAHGRNSA